MTEKWSAVDDYLIDRLIPPDSVLEQALAENAAANLPSMDVAPNQGKFLHIAARMMGARRILEIGTLGGYSTIWLARALPRDGKVVTLEANPVHARVAKTNIERAGLSGLVDIRVGPAIETLPALAGQEPFDLIFIDADKPNNPAYLDWAIKLSRPGSVIISDNVVRNGGVIDPDSSDPAVPGLRRHFDMMANEPRLTATALQTVGGKGWDGFVIGIVE